MLHGKNACHKTDNQNVERIMLNGSHVTELHEEAVAIYGFCLQHCVHLSVKWIPREENGQAD